jgi:hypothetical protein
MRLAPALLRFTQLPVAVCDELRELALLRLQLGQLLPHRLVLELLQEQREVRLRWG